MKFLLIILLTTFIVLSNAGFLKGACSDSDEFCGNNGLCEFGPFQNERATHWCRCKEGFGGANCEKRCDLNCAPDEKCVFDFAFRAQCVCKDCDNHGQQLSQCPVGFGGSNCSRHGWCYGNEGCLNGGACIGSGADARCSCLSGYTGRRCELDVDECAAEDAVVCYNGECINTFGSYECKCHPGFIQPECIFEGTAFDNPPPVERACIRSLIADANGKDERCRNSGVCVTDGMNQTRCECPPGFEGELCEKDVDECAHSPCQNGATCTNYKGGFECFCMIGFEGDLCEINVDNCVGNKCANGSKCIDGIGWYTCECPYGRMGTYCENVDPCALDSDLCNGRGTCVSLPETGGFECNCDRGFSGERCDVDFDECKELSHHTELCYHGGTCVNLPGTFKCDCPRGYNGTRCEEILNTCESENVHCENGGSCFVGPDQEPICQCEQGFIGKRCESKCPDGFGGVRCDVNLSVPICGRNIAKCLNKGMCINGMCRCSANYTGDHCEMSRKELYAFSVENSCHRDPCLNNATCINVDHKIGYVCICPEGFDGDVCERKKDYCDSHPCFNGGTCERHSTDFTCKCAAGYTGKHCETEQSCSSRTCKNGGRCVDAGGRLVCECSYGFAGPTCEHKVEVERFKTTESLLKDLCRSRNCSSRANDGNCDLDCNYGACDFDGGDCTGNQRPFANCRYGNMCAHLFANGVCNEACNNEECLYDGMDCLPQVPRCPVHIREHCADRYANGHCDSECNTDGCGFDGGDCDNSTQIVLSDIRVKLLISPTRFQKEGAEFLITASSALRSVIRIQRDDNGPLVFEWNGEEEGDRIPMNMKKLKDQRILSEHIRHRRGLSETRNNQNGVVVWLEVEVNDQKSETCKMDRSSCLFSTSQSVVDYFSAEIAKKRDGLFGVPIYEAMVAKPRTASKWSDQGLVMAVIGFVVVGIVIAGVLVMNDEKRTRKRRIISAPVWMPPTEQENEKMRKHNNLSSSQNSLLGNNGYFDNKRRRVDLGYNMIGNEQYNYRNGGGYPVNFASEFGGYGNTEVPLQLNENGKEVPELHYQASGNGRIVIPLDKNNVNEMDKKYGRRALHWLASNNTGKSEELIIEEANMCIQAGAEVNARDFDDDTALMLAVRAKRVRLAVVLMSAGADPTIFNKSERSALHEAAVNLDFRMICILLTDKRLVQEIDELDRNGKSALMEVARLDRDTQIAQFLINKGAKIENDGASRKDSEVYKGRTALHFAAMVGNLTMVEFLVLQNANKDKQDEMGQTPIMLAAKEGHLETVQYLLSQGASMDATDQLDKTARQIAESQHHYDIVDLIDRAAIDKEHNENMMRQRLHHPSKVGVSKMTRPTIKAVKRSASRKGYQSSSSRDSTIHMTPPPSDGSLSSPSPQHYLNTTRTTPTVLNYPNSPVSQFATNCSNMYNPNSNGSCSASSDSSPEYTSQEMEMTNNTMNGASMWYGNSPPYPKTMNGFYDNAMSNMDRSNQTALYF